MPTYRCTFVDEQGHYLVERYLFSYLTSGRDLLRLGDNHPPAREAPLILANPAFDDSSAPPAREATHRDVRSIDMITRSLLPTMISAWSPSSRSAFTECCVGFVLRSPIVSSGIRVTCIRT